MSGDEERRRTWGLALHAARTQAGVSQVELAKRLNSHQANVSNWERGRNIPEPADVFAIEDALGLAPGELSHLLGFIPVHADAPACTVHRAVIEDQLLTDQQRRAMLAMYEAIVGG